MKKTKIYCFGLLLALALGTVSCRETEKIADDIDIPGLGGTEEAWTELDEWLFQNFTAPYNIEVVYRWDAAQMYTNVTSTQLVPVEKDLVQPMMAAIRDVWFEPYNSASHGANFMRQLTPKKVVLVGSYEYESGAVKLGQAEGGNKVLLLAVNHFDATDEDALRQSLHVILHEFGHILHQNKMYNQDFPNISAGLYDSSGWKEVDRGRVRYDHPESWSEGFICNYAMNGKDDDFVEMLSMILVYGRDWFETKVLAGARDPENPTVETKAYSMLQQKLAEVRRYMLESWGIYFYDENGQTGLETYVQEAVKRTVENPPLK